MFPIPDKFEPTNNYVQLELFPMTPEQAIRIRMDEMDRKAANGIDGFGIIQTSFPSRWESSVLHDNIAVRTTSLLVLHLNYGDINLTYGSRISLKGNKYWI